MSLVTTPSSSSSLSSRQTIAMSEDLPVPTGPATPSRNARVTCGFSSTEKPPWAGGVGVLPLLQQRRRCGGYAVRLGEVRDGTDDHLDVGTGVQQPLGRLDRVERAQLEGCGAQR